jgi:hypothetical protein
MFSDGSSQRRCHASRVMIAILSVTSVLIGTAFAWMAARRPAHRKVMETFGGLLLIAGFALLGYSLDCIVGRP